MNVGELKLLLANLPDDMQVVLNVEAGQVVCDISKEYSGVIDGKLYLSEL